MTELTLEQQLAKTQEELKKAQERISWYEAAHLLLANQEAFISEPQGSVFFFTPGFKDGTPSLALNLNDTFYYACADAESFDYADAPLLVEIAKQDGWAGLVKWAQTKRARNGEPFEPQVPRTKTALKVMEDKNLAEQRLDQACKLLEEFESQAQDGHGYCHYCEQRSTDPEKRHTQACIVTQTRTFVHDELKKPRRNWWKDR